MPCVYFGAKGVRLDFMVNFLGLFLIFIIPCSGYAWIDGRLAMRLSSRPWRTSGIAIAYFSLFGLIVFYAARLVIVYVLRSSHSPPGSLAIFVIPCSIAGALVGLGLRFINFPSDKADQNPKSQP